MIEIKDLLGRWSSVLLNEGGKKATVAKVISEAIGADLKTEDIKIQNGKIYLDLKPIYKNEIFLKQEKIISELERNLGKTAPKNIF